MESWATSEAVRRNMQANKRRDTKPELAVRRLLHAGGLRFRVDFPPVPTLRRRADVVFTRARVAVFIDGCFWHGCPEHRVAPKSNADYWRVKIATNQGRDADTDTRLVEAGWTVVRIWEHEDPVGAAAQVTAMVQARRSASTGA